MDSSKELVRFSNVSKSYQNGTIIALREVDFSADEGEFLFLVGRSGAGKSTIIRLLVRQEIPTEGSIEFGEVTVEAIPRNLLPLYRQQLGIVFQDLKLIPSKTVKENVEFALEIIDKSKKDVKETAEYLIETVGLQDRANLFPRALSGGEKQRVAIARALANDPKLFIADEPTGNLDPATSEEIMALLEKINSWGTTVMVVTHDLNMVEQMKKRVLKMEMGRLVDDIR